MHALEWARMPSDLIFIGAGVVPLAIAALKTYLGLRSRPHGILGKSVASEAA
jgi:hypothetical protein